MKIEMLEQAAASYLRNVVGCEIVTTNWRPGLPMLRKLDGDPRVAARGGSIIQDVKAVFPGVDIFKKNDVLQLIRQCEIDVVGIKLSEEGKKVVYFYDTAFHRYGLHYKDPVERVLKKSVRAFLVADAFFPGCEAKIAFLTPKCSPTQASKIVNGLSAIEASLRSYNPGIAFSFLAGADFSEFLEDILSLAPYVADDADLFLRGEQLRILASGNKAIPNLVSGADPALVASSAPVPNKQHIQGTFGQLLSSGKITPSLEAELKDPAYAKKNFRLGLPFLAELSSIAPKDTYRFYPETVLVNGTAYRICSQWVPERRSLFDAWAAKLS